MINDWRTRRDGGGNSRECIEVRGGCLGIQGLLRSCHAILDSNVGRGCHLFRCNLFCGPVLFGALSPFNATVKQQTKDCEDKAYNES